MPLSPVALAERVSCNRAVRETIGRQLKAEYDTSHPLPDRLLGLLQQLQPLQRDEERPARLGAAAGTANALVSLVEGAREKRSRMALLLSHLRTRRTSLQQAIDAAREALNRSRQCRRTRLVGLSGAGLT